MTDFQTPYLLVGVAGEAGVGKTTVMEYLRGAHQFRCMEPADNVKDVCRAMGWDGRKDDRGRTFLQTIGAAGRAYDLDTWVQMTDAQMQQELVRETSRHAAGMQYDLIPRICVAGIRYQNEAEWLLERGGLLLYVVRPDSPDALTGEAREHESEVAARQLNIWLVCQTRGLIPNTKPSPVCDTQGQWLLVVNDNNIVFLRRRVGTMLHRWKPDLFPLPVTAT